MVPAEVWKNMSKTVCAGCGEKDGAHAESCRDLDGVRIRLERELSSMTVLAGVRNEHLQLLESILGAGGETGVHVTDAARRLVLNLAEARADSVKAGAQRDSIHSALQTVREELVEVRANAERFRASQYAVEEMLTDEKAAHAQTKALADALVAAIDKVADFAPDTRVGSAMDAIQRAHERP